MSESKLRDQSLEFAVSVINLVNVRLLFPKCPKNPAFYGNASKLTATVRKSLAQASGFQLSVPLRGT